MVGETKTQNEQPVDILVNSTDQGYHFGAFYTQTDLDENLIINRFWYHFIIDRTSKDFQSNKQGIIIHITSSVKSLYNISPLTGFFAEIKE